jgi:hypothetical protein
MKFSSLRYLLPLLPFAVAGTVQAQLLNGDFATGNLSHWTTFVTANGNLGSYYGLPNVVSFDVAGTGTSSYAAQFQVGEVSHNSTAQGGGIYQTFNCSAGQYFIYADIAAIFTAGPSTNNYSAGLFTLLMDGAAIDSTDLGSISGGQTLRSTLDATIPLSQGSHQLRIEITRPWLNGGGFAYTPLEYLDNIQATPVPEPSGILLEALGLSLLFAAARNPKIRQRHT